MERRIRTWRDDHASIASLGEKNNTKRHKNDFDRPSLRGEIVDTRRRLQYTHDVRKIRSTHNQPNNS